VAQSSSSLSEEEEKDLAVGEAGVSELLLSGDTGGEDFGPSSLARPVVLGPEVLPM